MKLLIMKHTVVFIAQEAKNGNQQAINQLAYYDTLKVEEKVKYLVLTNKTE